MSIGEIFAKAGVDTLLGMGIVFSMLVLISFIIYLFKFTNPDNRRKAGADGSKAVSAKAAGGPAADSAVPGNKNAIKNVGPAGSKNGGMPAQKGGGTADLRSGGEIGQIDLKREQEEIIAVITAAVTAHKTLNSRNESGIGECEYIVRSVRRRR